MKIVEYYSHLNGWEHIQVHKPTLWEEIVDVIEKIDAEKCRTKVSKAKRNRGELLYSPIDMNNAFKQELEELSWSEERRNYWVTKNPDTILDTIPEEPETQKRMIEERDEEAIRSYTQTDFVKERIAIEVQFGKYSFVAYDLFVKHMAFYTGRKIDVGVEILPMKSLQKNMSDGVPYYEKGLYDMLRNGRASPPVPLVIVGITE